MQLGRRYKGRFVPTLGTIRWKLGIKGETYLTLRTSPHKEKTVYDENDLVDLMKKTNGI